MAHEFEVTKEIAIDASPEQVWEAIATGPGLDSWFLGSNEVEPREGGIARLTVGDVSEEGIVTTWEPLKRFAHRTREGEDGSLMALEYLIEGRGDGRTVLRLVQSGFLGGDWEAEYEALNKGWGMYLRTLDQYLTYFPGKTATPISAGGPRAADEEHVWEALKRGLGLTGTVREGDQVRFSLAGSAPIDGVVDSVLFPTFLGVRTSEGLYRFVGRGGAVGVGHHIFAAGVDQEDAARAWQTWLTRLFE